MKRVLRNKDGFTVLEVIGVIVIVVLLLSLLFWPSAKKSKTTVFKTTPITGVFTMVPTSLGHQSTIVKFSLTNTNTGAGIAGRKVRFTLSNTNDSMFTKKSWAITNGKGDATISIRAKKKRKGEGIISATVLVKVKKVWLQATEDSLKFEIDGDTGPSTY